MKTQISAADTRFLAYELNNLLSSSRIDKAYQLGDKELKIKIHAPNRGALELVISPTYFCATNYPRKAPEEPTSFAMQLRKHLGGAYIREVRQHEFDRIVEFIIEAKEKKYVLVAEFFSKGNVIFCGEKNKILGLLEWQKWKDRKLGVGQIYEYPPKAANPLEINEEKLFEILNKTNKKTAAVLATEAGLGGVFAEEVCLLAGIEKNKTAKELGREEKEKLGTAYFGITEKIRNHKIHAQGILEDDTLVDITPIELSIYKNNKKKEYNSFNEAVDEYFSAQEHECREKESGDRYRKEKNKLLEIKKSQQEHYNSFIKESVESKETGDLIYQNYSSFEAILKTINEEKTKGLSWDELKKKYAGNVIEGLLIEDITRDGTVTVKIGRKQV